MAKLCLQKEVDKYSKNVNFYKVLRHYIYTTNIFWQDLVVFLEVDKENNEIKKVCFFSKGKTEVNVKMLH